MHFEERGKVVDGKASTEEFINVGSGRRKAERNFVDRRAAAPSELAPADTDRLPVNVALSSGVFHHVTCKAYRYINRKDERTAPGVLLERIVLQVDDVVARRQTLVLAKEHEPRERHGSDAVRNGEDDLRLAKRYVAEDIEDVLNTINRQTHLPSLADRVWMVGVIAQLGWQVQGNVHS